MTILTIAKRLLPAVLFAAAGVGVAPSAYALTAKEVANLSGTDRQKILIEGAKKEGEVSWYTSLIVDQVARPVVTAFEKKYPFLKVKFVRSDTSKILQRVMAENRAKSIRVDVIVADLAEALKKANLALPFTSPLLADYPKDYIDPDRIWVSIRTSWQGIAWNTNLVKDSEAPKTWEALLNPRWKGKLVWGASAETGAPRMISHIRKIWGEDKALDYLKKLQKQDVRTLSGSVRSVLDQVIAGEYAVGISMAMHHVAISKAKGAPIFGTSPEPALARSGTLHFVKGAPHPHAGMLFFDFMLDKDGGQQVFRKARYNPAHPAVDPLPEMSWIQPSKIGKKELLMSPEEVNSMRKKSADLYKRIFRR